MAGDYTIEFKASLSNKQVIAPTYRPMPARPIMTVAVDTDTVSDRLESWGESDKLPTLTSIEAKARSKSFSVSLASLASSVRVAGANWHRQYAIALSLPLLNPYLESNATFDHGANFAVAGSTALDYTFFTTNGVYNPTTNISLGDQLNWFKSHLNTICQAPTECEKLLSKALVFVGEIGGNDVYYPLIQGKSIQEIYTYLPFIIEAITNAVKEVTHLGAVNIVVPGNLPMGCLPAGLTLVFAGDATTYDDMGCLKELNELALVHNNYLQESLALLRLEFPHVDIIYADYYAAYQTILRYAANFGFEEKSLLRSCCGIGGLYNYDENRKCGSRGVPVCSNPVQYISWDGVHLTQEAYRHIAKILFQDILGLPGIRYM
ncbi:unnamed protein product [Ilex paraguariensis]|uniref:Uncharacterized protein n=1 Tax=Ilex paraguariensis TaxID=185542 RepID=A0ABC8SNZ0_9AQUA